MSGSSSEINDKAVREVMPQIDLTRLKETVEYNEAKRVGIQKKQAQTQGYE